MSSLASLTGAMMDAAAITSVDANRPKPRCRRSGIHVTSSDNRKPREGGTPVIEPLVRVKFSKHQQETPADETAARDQLRATIEQAIEGFQTQFPQSEVIEVEMHPCNCDECAAT
jgi:hypothetical protein